jgi:hypothetical protein
MNPNPFSLLKNFTLPVVMSLSSFSLIFLFSLLCFFCSATVAATRYRQRRLLAPIARALSTDEASRRLVTPLTDVPPWTHPPLGPESLQMGLLSDDHLTALITVMGMEGCGKGSLSSVRIGPTRNSRTGHADLLPALQALYQLDCLPRYRSRGRPVADVTTRWTRSSAQSAERACRRTVRLTLVICGRRNGA